MNVAYRILGVSASSGFQQFANVRFSVCASRRSRAIGQGYRADIGRLLSAPCKTGWLNLSSSAIESCLSFNEFKSTTIFSSGQLTDDILQNTRIGPSK